MEDIISMSIPCSLSTLPTELLDEILNRLKNNTLDILRCRNVCVSWRLTASELYTNHVNKIPLLLSFGRDFDHGILCNILYSEEEEEEEEEIDLPNPQEFWICSSIKQGWLLIMDRSFPHRLILYNPISRNEIFLPSAAQLPQFLNHININRCITSTPSPLDQDCIVLILYGCNLAFCKAGDEEWKSLLDQDFVDIMMYKGLLYGTDVRGFIFGFELGSCLKIIFLMRPPFQEFIKNRNLIESFSGDFLMINRKWRWIDDDDEDGMSFEVYKIDFSSGEWKKIENLGDEVLFLGPSNSSRSVSVSGRGNCIYFIHNECEVMLMECGAKYVTMYDVETSCIKRLRVSEPGKSQFLWIVPDLSR